MWACNISCARIHPHSVHASEIYQDMEQAWLHLCQFIRILIDQRVRSLVSVSQLKIKISSDGSTKASSNVGVLVYSWLRAVMSESPELSDDRKITCWCFKEFTISPGRKKIFSLSLGFWAWVLDMHLHQPYAHRSAWLPNYFRSSPKQRIHSKKSFLLPASLSLLCVQDSLVLSLSKQKAFMLFIVHQQMADLSFSSDIIIAACFQ